MDDFGIFFGWGLMVIVLLFVGFSINHTLTAPCSDFSNSTAINLPVRCVEFYTKETK